MDRPVTLERIADGDVWREHDHRLRYHLARGLVGRNDAVLDAACGVGYGSYILSASRAHTIVGVDKRTVTGDYAELSDGRARFVTADLNTDERDRVLDGVGEFDVSVSFETIEHLADPADFVAWLCRVTTRTIVASVPVVPSKHWNEYHLHDFDRDDLPAMFEANGWQLSATLDQPSESSAIYVFGVF